MRNKATLRFTSRMVVGCLMAIILGKWVDEKISTTPWIMLLLLLYVMVGSICLLIREAGE